MPDYSQYGVPRPVELGREVRIEQRRSPSPAALFALGGVLVLCVCMFVGVVAAAYFYGTAQSGKSSAVNLPFLSGATATPTASSEPTPVPYLKSGRDEAGLRVTVTAYQRPLPAQDISIPDGQELALVSLRLDNTRTTGGPIKFDAQDFALVSQEGDHFAADSGTITTGTMLKQGEIDPGKSASGDIVFYVYSDVSDLMLAWTSGDGITRLFKVTR